MQESYPIIIGNEGNYHVTIPVPTDFEVTDEMIEIFSRNGIRVTMERGIMQCMPEKVKWSKDDAEWKLYSIIHFLQEFYWRQSQK